MKGYMVFWKLLKVWYNQIQVVVKKVSEVKLESKVRDGYKLFYLVLFLFYRYREVMKVYK